MKKYFYSFAFVAIALFSLSACNEIEPDTHMGVTAWTINKASYDKDADSPTRAYAELLVSGYHEQPYTLTYTLDGKNGLGDLAIHHLPTGDAGNDLRTGIFNGNCPSGSQVDIPCYKVNNRTEQYHGLARFLMPMLEPGTHTFSATITNQYGESLSETVTFVVEGK